MMDVRIGSKVRLLNEVGEGIVTGFNKQGMALVMLEDGFEIPYLPKQLVVVGNSNPAESHQGESNGIASYLATSLNESVYLAFVLEGILKDQPKISARILNQRKESFLIALYSETDRVFTLEYSGELGGGSSKIFFTGVVLFLCSMH